MDDQSTSPTVSFNQPSPALTHNTVSSSDHNGLNLDLTLGTSISFLINYIIQPLAPHYSHQTLLDLRDHLQTLLTQQYRPTWDEFHPQLGSGSRSLICSKHLGLPVVMKVAAEKSGVDEGVWKKAIGTLKARRIEDNEAKEEWEAWCDPGMVVWRFGGWEWEDIGFEPSRVIKEPFQTIWQASHIEPNPPSTSVTQVITPARPSHAIPIRAPTVFRIPPTPLAAEASSEMEDPPRVPSPSLLPAASIGLNHKRASTIMDFSTMRSVSPVSSEASQSDGEKFHSRSTSDSMTTGSSKSGSSRGHESTSSIASSISDSNNILTPSSRPNSADPFKVPELPQRKTPTLSTSINRGRTPSPNTPINNATPTTITPTGVPTPSVTPYDGGNVTVLGGGVKLGGGSRPSSVISMSRVPIDRTRSPSISMASRALNTALGPNSNSNPGSVPSSPRKVRTRRRIMPTYLGHLGQPGVGGPVMGVFGQFAGNIQAGPKSQAGYGWPHGQPGGPVSPGVGVGVAPPSLGMAGGLGMRPMTLGMQRMM